jgi:hypothetical protein
LKAARQDEIELLGGEGEIGGVSPFEIDAQPGLARVLAGDAHEGAADVEPQQVAAGEFDEFDGEVTGPGRDFEHAGAGADVSSDPARDAFEFIEVLGCLARVSGGDEAFHADAFVRLRPRIGHGALSPVSVVKRGASGKRAQASAGWRNGGRKMMEPRCRDRRGSSNLIQHEL